MVNNKLNISAYPKEPPSGPENERVILDGPLYDPAEVMDILGCGDDNTVLWTRDCNKDVQKLAFDKSDVRALVQEAILKGHYLNSQWCLQKPDGPWAACDAYCLVRNQWSDSERKQLSVEYYIKFAQGKLGKILLVVSCHKSQ